MIQIHPIETGAAIYKRWTQPDGTPRHKWVSVSRHEIPYLIDQLRAVYDNKLPEGVKCPTA